MSVFYYTCKGNYSLYNKFHLLFSPKSVVTFSAMGNLVKFVSDIDCFSHFYRDLATTTFTQSAFGAASLSDCLAYCSTHRACRAVQYLVSNAMPGMGFVCVKNNVNLFLVFN